MKALTLTQPWATLVAIGAKKVETRSWTTSYRGRLAIHAAMLFPKTALGLCRLVGFGEPLFNAGYLNGIYDWIKPLPLGCVIATCELARIDGPLKDGADIYFTRDERAFGDLSAGRYAWYLENIKMLDKPIPAKGSLGLWEWQP